MKLKSMVKEAIVADYEIGSPDKARRLTVKAPSKDHSMSKHLTRTVAAWVERLMGLPMMGGASEAIAKVGLRGLGINVGNDF
jgi:hypothetical protein